MSVGNDSSPKDLSKKLPEDQVLNLLRIKLLCKHPTDKPKKDLQHTKQHIRECARDLSIKKLDSSTQGAEVQPSASQHCVRMISLGTDKHGSLCSHGQ